MRWPNTHELVVVADHTHPSLFASSGQSLPLDLSSASSTSLSSEGGGPAFLSSSSLTWSSSDNVGVGTAHGNPLPPAGPPATATGVTGMSLACATYYRHVTLPRHALRLPRGGECDDGAGDNTAPSSVVSTEEYFTEARQLFSSGGDGGGGGGGGGGDGSSSVTTGGGSGGEQFYDAQYDPDTTIIVNFGFAKCLFCGD